MCKYLFYIGLNQCVIFLTCSILFPSPQGEGLGVRSNIIIFNHLPHPSAIAIGTSPQGEGLCQLQRLNIFEINKLTYKLYSKLGNSKSILTAKL